LEVNQSQNRQLQAQAWSEEHNGKQAIGSANSKQLAETLDFDAQCEVEDMSDDEITIIFPNASTADANVFAGTLADDLRDSAKELTVDVRRDRPDAQDFGATLVLILGTAAATKVAAGIGRWISRHSGARVLLKKKDGTELLIENADSASAAKIVAALNRAK